MNTENAQKIKQSLYERAKEKGDRFGAYGRPSITDYDISVEILGQIEENKSRLPLKELGEIVKSIAGNYNYDFNVPKELSDYVPLELQEKIQKAAIKATEEGKEIDTREINKILSEKENDALQVYQLLSQAYNRAVSLGTCNYFADMNELGNQITEKYKPKEDKE